MPTSAHRRPTQPQDGTLRILPILPIPRIPPLDLAEAGPAWAPAGLAVQVLAQDQALPAPPTELDAVLAIGWEERGLAIVVEVVGDGFEEHPDEQRLFESTSVEVFVRPPADAGLTAQVVVAPGVDERQGVPRCHAYDHRDAARRASLPGISALAARRRTAQGYALAVVMPLAAIGIRPSAGAAVDVRVIVNHRRPGGERIRQLWSTRAIDGFAPIIFADGAAGEPVLASAWGCAAGLTEYAACALVPAARAGDFLRVRQDGLLVGMVSASPWHGLALAALRMPLAGLRAGVPVTLALAASGADLDPAGETLLGYAQVADPAAQLSNRVRFTTEHPGYPYRLPRAQVEAAGVHGEFIFRGPRFPRLAVGTPELRGAARLVACATRWLDGEGREVAEAARPGRYGAEVSMRFADGRRVVARETAVRITDGAPPDLLASPLGRLVALALDGGDRAWPPGINEPREGALASLTRNREAARLLAAFLEDPSPSCRPDWIERRWWHRVRTRLGTQERYQAYVQHPPQWRRGGDRRWPAIIYMHGGWNDYPPFERRAPFGELPERLRASAALGAVVYSLQASDWWDSFPLADFVARIIAEDGIDPDRVVVTGYSMGGYGAWQAILDDPGLYAAAVPMGAGPGQAWEAPRCAAVPIWCVNGDADDEATIAQARAMVDAVRSAGGDARLTILPGLDHLAALQAAPEVPGLWEWALQQRRGGVAAPRSS